MSNNNNNNNNNNIKHNLYKYDIIITIIVINNPHNDRNNNIENNEDVTKIIAIRGTEAIAIVKTITVETYYKTTPLKNLAVCNCLACNEQELKIILYKEKIVQI